MRTLKYGLLAIIVVVLLVVLLYRVPPINRRLAWRLDFALTYLRGVLDPVSAVPTALPDDPHIPAELITPSPTNAASSATAEAIANVEAIAGDEAVSSVEAAATLVFTPTTGPTATPFPSPTPIPGSVSLSAPSWEKQDMNNCGPASLSMYMRYYGWDGDQFEISSLLKPQQADRNVNVEELAYYVRTRAGWLNAEYRVGGDLDLLKELVAAGVPVLVEESFYFEAPYWPNDDLWAAHYFLVTGYDDQSHTFSGQDSYHGPDQRVSYEKLDEYWQVFNRVYVLLYLPEQENTIKAILGTDWDPDVNRKNALELAMAETETQPENPFAWFNMGTNLVYFDRYTEAAQAYDEARNLGLPQRMLRYQFGPFLAYFHSGQTEELMTLAQYALQRTPNAEEALLWRGWGYYRLGQTSDAMADFRQALEENPYYQDAQYALDYVNENR